jgi:hypothetical protein
MIYLCRVLKQHVVFACRYILRPAWLRARKSLALECTTVVVAQILEVLEAVNDQIERSSFGDVTLEGDKVK